MGIWILLLLCLFAVALLYSTVGHGGASGYIAVLTIFSYPLLLVKQDTLILNILVSSIAWYIYYKQGFFRRKLWLRLMIGSVPLAFLGGRMNVDTGVLRLILGGVLLLPACLFFIPVKSIGGEDLREMQMIPALGIGMVLGFVSGLTGIGGGVFLSPILILGRWADQKQTAAVSAAFILVNSVSGLLGSLKQSPSLDPNLFYFAIVCLGGGFLGSRLGSARLPEAGLRFALGLVLLVASAKLLLG